MKSTQLNPVLVFFYLIWNVFSGSTLRAQDTYRCDLLKKSIVKIVVTQDQKSMKYLNNTIQAYIHTIVIGKDTVGKYKIYKHNTALYITDATNTINPAQDQTLFELPKKAYKKFNLKGILGSVGLRATRFMKINDRVFYYYDNEQQLKGKYQIHSIIFDESIQISEIKISLDNSICQCTRQGIEVRLR